MRMKSTKHDWYFKAISRENHPELLGQNEGLKQLAGVSETALNKAEDAAIEAKRKHEDLMRQKNRQEKRKSQAKPAGKVK
jgi:hypothetical protein